MKGHLPAEYLAIGWALDRQIFRWEVPFHNGAVRYFKSLGIWGEEEDAHNDALLRRQAVLIAAWQAHQAAGGGKGAWYPRRSKALREAGFKPIWETVQVD